MHDFIKWLTATCVVLLLTFAAADALEYELTGKCAECTLLAGWFEGSSK